MKRCTRCKKEKVESEFGRNKKAPDGLRWTCKVCCKEQQRCWNKANPEKTKEYNRRYRTKNHEKYKEGQRRLYKANRFAYALRSSCLDAEKRGHKPCVATVEELKAAYTGRCGICGVPAMELTRRLHMDHDHATGIFRGFLCGKCNKMLGLAMDSQEILIDALHYLMSHQHQEV